MLFIRQQLQFDIRVWSGWFTAWQVLAGNHGHHQSILHILVPGKRVILIYLNKITIDNSFLQNESEIILIHTYKYFHQGTPIRCLDLF